MTENSPLERNDEFTADHSLDDETWTEVDSRELPDDADVQDAALFATSHASDERSTVEFVVESEYPRSREHIALQQRVQCMVTPSRLIVAWENGHLD